jgi:hypothetical protein
MGLIRQEAAWLRFGTIDVSSVGKSHLSNLTFRFQISVSCVLVNYVFIIIWRRFSLRA